MKYLPLIATLAVVGCAQDRQIHYQWNGDHTAAAYVDEPSSWTDPRPQPCRIAPIMGGEADNWWRWNQVTFSGFEKFCTAPDGHVATLFMPNNMGVAPAPVGYVAPALIEGASELGAGALIAGGARDAAHIATSAVGIGNITQTTTVSAGAASINNLSAASSSVSGAAAGAIAH